MIKIEKASEGSYPVLDHSQDVFREALELKTDRVHVVNKDGKDYDLVYTRNNDIVSQYMPATVAGEKLLPDYSSYDTGKKEDLYLDLFDGLENFFVEEIEEYSKALIDVVLDYTDMDIYTTDERISWFYEPDDRIHLVEELPEYNPETTMFVNESVESGFGTGDYHRLGSLMLFHFVFIMNWLLKDKNWEDIKYIDLMDKSNIGIGAIVNELVRFSRMFGREFGKHLIVTNDKIASFDRSFFDRFFSFDLVPEDSTEENTMVLFNIRPFQIHALFQKYGAESIKTGDFSEDFLNAAERYRKALFGSKKMLGVLARGSDYNLLKGAYAQRVRQAPIEVMIPTIKEWFESGGYDGIFLATEDKDILEKMRLEFGNKVTALAQNRYRTDEFGDARIISKLDAKKYSQEEFEANREDTTATYFLALYLLSKCEALISSGECSGYPIVMSLNDGKFKDTLLFDYKGKDDIEEIETVKLPGRLDLHSQELIEALIIGKAEEADSKQAL